MYCPHCGYPNTGVEVICSDCGFAIESKGPSMRKPEATEGAVQRQKVELDPSAKKEFKPTADSVSAQPRAKLAWGPKKLK